MATIDEKFEEFQRQNGDILHLFIKFALELKRSGRKRAGAKAIVERIRWEIMLTNKPGSDYKINNNYTSRLARWAMDTEPELKGFFQLRDLKSH
jgi:hypothetical protein